MKFTQLVKGLKEQNLRIPGEENIQTWETISENKPLDVCVYFTFILIFYMFILLILLSGEPLLIKRVIYIVIIIEQIYNIYNFQIIINV